MAVVVALLSAAAAAVVTWLLARRPTVVEAVSTSPARDPGGGDGSRWECVIDRLALGVLVADGTGRVTYRNPAASAMAGTHAGLLLDDTVNRLVQRSLAGEDARHTLELYGPPRVAVVVTSSPLPSGGAVVTIADVSERRRVDAVRTDFVVNISHELKTPVGAIAVLAETLVDEVDLEIVHRVADRMVDESHRMARTIDDLLELSRIELGEEPVLDVVDVADVVAGACDRTRSLAEARGITIAVLDVPPHAWVRGDARQLESALGNLVENGVKYSEPGGTVQVRVLIEGDWIEMMVADNGIGIPPEDHDRIFERFYRVDKGRSRVTGGTGLGLSIVRHVATNHGGDVLVSSHEGEGSTFVLRIPAALDRPGDGELPVDDESVKW
jgi:two-component system sensor histidine kinase SenX3